LRKDKCRVNNSARIKSFHQFESLYEEKKKLKEELGVSSPEEIISMINSLTDQVEPLYEQHNQS